MQTDPRTLALTIFSAWENSRLTLDIILDRNQSRVNALDQKDKKLFNAIVFGVFRHRETLDWIIAQHTHRPFQKIKQSVQYILRSAVFQLFFLDKIPAFAAIDTAVNQTKKTGDSKLAGFVNAVLRKISTYDLDLRYPETIGDPINFVRIKYSLPPWLAKKWVLRYGFEPTCRLSESLLQIPAITIRVNRLKTTPGQLKEELADLFVSIHGAANLSQSLLLTGPQMPISAMPPFASGCFQIQDEAAQMVSLLLDPKPGENILDACAGMGTKTCHIAELINNAGQITAMDIEASKLEALKDETCRLGIDIVSTRCRDLLKTSIKDFDTFFDRVLVDAPCSGLGVLRRNPDTRWRRKKNDVLHMAGRQKKMLNAAANLVKPGGILVYAVCSCEPEENETVITHFLDKRKDFSIDKDFNSDTLEPLKTDAHFIRTYPQADACDGFFAARLIRSDSRK